MKVRNWQHMNLIIILTIFCFIFGTFSVFSSYKLGYVQKIPIRMGWIQSGETENINYAVAGWENCLVKLDYSADIVFFGDSITRGSDFRKDFHGYKVCNLGLAGDTLLGMKRRVPMIASVNPKQVFVMGGVNSIRDTNVTMVIQTYSELLDLIRKAVPGAKIYVQSILPIAKNKENAWQAGGVCKNSTIRIFNKKLETLAKEKGMIYIDLYSVYELNGYLNPAYTVDGIHIYGHYEPWAAALKNYIY